MFIIRKYILAKSASEAIRSEKKFPVDECYVEDSYFKKEMEDSYDRNKPVGFRRK